MRTTKLFIEVEIPEALWNEIQEKWGDKIIIRKTREGYKIKIVQNLMDLFKMRLATLGLQVIDRLSKIKQ